jgi:IS30 family transposase
MFSKFMFAYPLRNKDAATICEALYHMFTTYGVCQTLISDRGSEFTLHQRKIWPLSKNNFKRGKINAVIHT